MLPPIARLTAEQAMYHFLSGYTAKVAGTERGVTEPSATFSALLRRAVPAAASGGLRQDAGRADRPARSQGLAGEHRLDRRPLRHRLADEAGPHPRHGRAALAGALDKASFRTDPVFGLEVPVAVPGVPAEVLTPRQTWADPSAYDAQARKLATMFRENFEQYRSQVPDTVAAAGPTA